MNIMQMMQQAQNIQKKLKKTQEELANLEISGESAGGSSVDSETVEMMEDIISAAIQQASNKAAAQMEEKMKAATGGINIPGLF